MEKKFTFACRRKSNTQFSDFRFWSDRLLYLHKSTIIITLGGGRERDEQTDGVSELYTVC